MTDTEAPAQQSHPPGAAAPGAPIATVRIAHEIPVVYADGVTNHVTAPGTTKFYLFRRDSDPKEQTSYSDIQVVQVIMPAFGFVDMFAFFEHRIKVMLANKHISQEVVDERRAFYSTYPMK